MSGPEIKTLSWSDSGGEKFEIVTQSGSTAKAKDIVACVKVTPSKHRPTRATHGVYVSRAQARELVGWLRLVLDME